ncbi:hypothetical protein THOM_0653 [Trachipleistophora hominis]|uniref:Uncharacterized protein n=1 Tax=Trachipleistophora hominis TaxID=72359 RepID=L7JZ67_TRAHO|nr:hypothetical protein THOM_0653 [Trachipleistophora hominis]
MYLIACEHLYMSIVNYVHCTERSVESDYNMCFRI